MTKGTRIFISVVIIGGFLVGVLTCSCRSRRPIDAGNLHSKALSEWDRNMEVLERAVAGGTLRGTEFEDACVFFEEVTGNEVRGNPSTFGYLATDETAEDLKRLKRWLRKNANHLTWDEDAGRVVCDVMPRHTPP